VTPLAQFAETVPDTDDEVCVVMSHFTSAQFPSGSPAIVEDPQAPLKADAADVVEPDPLELPVAVPDEVPSAEGAAGFPSFVTFSKEQPVASIDATSRDSKQGVFIGRPLQFCTRTYSSGM
jgi:hypothetical protein